MMAMRRLTVSLFLLIAATAFTQTDGITATAAPTDNPPTALSPAPTVLSREQIQEMIRISAEKDVENDKRQRDYTYVEREEEHKLNGKGEVTSTETHTYEVMEIYNEQVRRLVAKDDKPLSAKNAAKEEEKIQKIIDKRKNESDSQREKRLKEEEKERQDNREFVKEIADAYDFKLAGVETLDGRETYAIDGEPRPGFEPKRKEAKILPKFRFRVWIDRVENQWVKLDAQCIDTVSFGLFIARIHKGSRILIDTTRVNDEVWLPRHIALHVDVRVALLKNFNVNEDISYKDYKKFHAASRITGMEEVE
ncbi:MAG TPA: hypothetical protein VLL05_16835 [Terriglobales bacterium]|nr:hypothetical protein [Terriglobales bacterium]